MVVLLRQYAVVVVVRVLYRLHRCSAVADAAAEDRQYPIPSAMKRRIVSAEMHEREQRERMVAVK